MAETAAPKLTIIPAGKITAENLPELHKLVGSTTYHGTKIVGPL
jgi:copper homeostasis protein CutC